MHAFELLPTWQLDEVSGPSASSAAAEVAAVDTSHSRRHSGELSAPPMKRRRAAAHPWAPSVRVWWQQLAVLVVALPAILAEEDYSIKDYGNLADIKDYGNLEDYRRLADIKDYGNLHGVVGAKDLSMFRKVGSGECLAPASRPVRGRARRDFTHLWCRLLCVDTCLGYSFAPCEKVCTLHGNPAALPNTSDADGWATVNGGGRIDTSSGRCGSSCYQRMAPCRAGRVTSNTADMTTLAMPFGSSRSVTCPNPFVGMLKLRCGLFGPYVEAGRCRSPCAPGIVVNGNFDVYYSQFNHGSLTEATCPAGASGTIILSCNDGKATWEKGRCGYDCVLGSLIAGDAVLSYPPMNHTSFMNMSCPNTTRGNVTIGCWDSLVKTVEGQCNYNCDSGEVNLRVGNTLGMVKHGAFNHSDENETDCEPLTNFTGKITVKCHRGKVAIIGGHCDRHCMPGSIGVGVKAVPYQRFDHETTIKIKCLPGFIGELELKCEDGNTTLVKGECMMHCLPGSVTSNGVNLPHAGFNHTLEVNLTCPWPSHYGFVVIKCTDGAVSYYGMCGSNCKPGFYMSHSARVGWSFLRHKITTNITCPTPWVGNVLISCYDGSHRYMSGWCGAQCPSGTFKKNGAVVVYPVLNHSQVKNFKCTSLFPTGLSFSGGVDVRCYDGRSSGIGHCEADCPNGKLSRNGAQVFYPNMRHKERFPGICAPGTPSNPTFGQVLVKCHRGYASAVSGTCGNPCLAGVYTGRQTKDEPVAYPDIGHMSSKYVTCPPHLSGYILLNCESGVINVIGNGTCGKRCPTRSLSLYGATLESPLMEHRAKLQSPCDYPFNGFVFLQCDFGILNATSFCQAQCKAGSAKLLYGASVPYPKMMSGVTFKTNCPRGFVNVPLVIRCDDGQGVIIKGGCYKHCSADYFWEPSKPGKAKIKKGEGWSVQHYEIRHSTTTIRDCPQYYDGTVDLYCWTGLVTMTKGHCSKNCRPSRFTVRPGVIVRNREMRTGQMATSIPCPPSFDGTMRLLCTEGVVSLGEGGCNSTCAPSIVLTAPHGELGDNEVAAIACPDTGTITIRCNDGRTTVLGGRCLKGCKPGTVIDANGTRIEHPYIRHNESLAGACSGLAKGVVTVACNDTVVIMTPEPGERCLRFCKSQAVRTPDGSTIFPGETKHGNQATVRCPNGLLGLVTVSCYDTEFTVVDGTCGRDNCPESYVKNNGAVLTHFAINNGWQAGPTQCPLPYEGEATFFCDNGTAKVNEVTTMLPVSPNDFAAVAIGNESSEDSRFILCGCCYPEGIPPGAAAVKGRDTGIYIWVAVMGGGLSLIIACFSGWYFLPRKKLARVWPERIKPPDPRPVSEQNFERILDQFTQELADNPELMQKALMNNFKLKALPPKEQKLALEDLRQNPQAVKKYFTRRSVQYLMACEEQARSGTTSPASPLSPKSLRSLRDSERESPLSPKSMASITPSNKPPQLALGFTGSTNPLSPGGSQAALAWTDVSAITNGEEPASASGMRQLGNSPASASASGELRQLGNSPASASGMVSPGATSPAGGLN